MTAADDAGQALWTAVVSADLVHLLRTLNSVVVAVEAHMKALRVAGADTLADELSGILLAVPSAAEEVAVVCERFFDSSISLRGIIDGD